MENVCKCKFSGDGPPGQKHIGMTLRCHLHQFMSAWMIFSCVRKIAKSDYQLRHLSIRLSTWNNSAPTKRIFMKLDIWGSFLKICRKKIQVRLQSDKSNVYVTRRPMHIYEKSRLILLRMRNVSDKYCRENQNTHFMFKHIFPKIVPFMRLRGKMWYS